MRGATSRFGLVAAGLVAATAVAACGGTGGDPVGPAPSATTQPAPNQASGRPPGALIDLTNWYLTLPTGKKDDPDDIYNPALATYTGPDFHLTDSGDGVVFTAQAGGFTTKGSNYPRSELREMNGSKKAGWTNTTGTHTLSVRQAVTQLPLVKPDVVTAQIHDTESDVIEIRLEGERLLAEYDDGGKDVTIDPAYQLGTPYDLTISATGGRIEVTYNGELKVNIPVSGSGWYFKSGSYVQSNTSKGEDAAAIGQVVVYALSVKHSD